MIVVRLFLPEHAMMGDWWSKWEMKLHFPGNENMNRLYDIQELLEGFHASKMFHSTREERISKISAALPGYQHMIEQGVGFYEYDIWVSPDGISFKYNAWWMYFIVRSGPKGMGADWPQPQTFYIGPDNKPDNWRVGGLIHLVLLMYPI